MIWGSKTKYPRSNMDAAIGKIFIKVIDQYFADWNTTINVNERVKFRIYTPIERADKIWMEQILFSVMAQWPQDQEYKNPEVMVEYFPWMLGRPATKGNEHK